GFPVVPPLCAREIGMQSEVSERAALRQGGGRVVEWVPAGIVVHPVAAEKQVDAEESARVESALISRRQVEGNDPLLLVLARLIVGVRNLQPVARRHEVQVKRIPDAGLIIDAIEEDPGGPAVMEGPEIIRVAKPAR